MGEKKEICATCCHAKPMRVDADVLSRLFCMEGPPCVIALPNSRGQAEIGSTFPAVDPAWSCGRWEQATSFIPSSNAGGETMKIPELQDETYG